MAINLEYLLTSSANPNKFQTLLDKGEINLDTHISEIREYTQDEEDFEYVYERCRKYSPDYIHGLESILERLLSDKATFIGEKRRIASFEEDPKAFTRQYMLQYGYNHCLDGTFAILKDFDAAITSLSEEVDLEVVKDYLVPFGLEAAIVGYSIAKYESIIYSQLNAFKALDALPPVVVENATSKMALMHDWGILDKLYFDHDENSSLVSRIIGTIADIDPETVRKILEAVYKPSMGNKKNHPFNNRETKLKVAQIKNLIGLK